jgi:hypothetical protein
LMTAILTGEDKISILFWFALLWWIKTLNIFIPIYWSFIPFILPLYWLDYLFFWWLIFLVLYIVCILIPSQMNS